MYMDAREEKDKYVLDFEVPGVKKEQIKLSVKKNLLSVEVEIEKDGEKDTYLLRERSSAFKKRSLQLPKDAKGSEAIAKVEEGILTVTIPRRAEEEMINRINVE